MDSEAFETEMRRFECYHGVRIVPAAYIVIRVDGRAFHGLTREAIKPFDEGFHDRMLTTTEALFRELGAIYGYTQSDEISVLLPCGSNLFDRSHEKLVSVAAGIASGVFSTTTGHQPASFDARVLVLPTSATVVDYFRWRQADAYRNCVSSWAYWMLRLRGLPGERPMSGLRAAGTLIGKGAVFKQEMLFSQFDINVNDLPAWQRRGVGFRWQEYRKVGTDPRTNEQREAVRRRIVALDALPMGEEYGALLAELVSQAGNCRGAATK